MRRCHTYHRCQAYLCLIVLVGLAASASSQSTPADSGGSAAAAYREGQSALGRNDLNAAEAAFERAVRIAPRDEVAIVALGGVLLREGKSAEAARRLEAARAISKSDLNAEVNLAYAYQQLGEQAKALPLFVDAVAGAQRSKQNLPSSVRAAYARALTATGRLSQAAIEMQAAIKSDPQNAILVGDLGSIYAQQKDWAQAQREFQAAVALNPSAPMAHLRLGLAMQAQSSPEALHELGQAAQLAPDDPQVQLEWGKGLAAAESDEQAVPVFQHVLALKANSLEATDQLAQAYQRTQRVPEAIELYKKVLAATPENPTVLTNLGMAYAQMQQAKDAVPLLQRAVALAPRNVTAYQDLAAAYVQLSRFAEAAAELRVALKLVPDSPQLHYNLGLTLKSEDDAAGAIPELERAEKLDTGAPEAPNLLGVLYMQAGRYAEASRELQISLRLRPENGEGWATLGSVYNKLDQLPEAVNALREAIKQLPQQPDPHLTLATVLTRQNQPAEAAAERKQAATLMRTHMNLQRAEVATNSAYATLKSGDLAEAMQQFKDALSYDPGYARAHLGMASVYDAQGKPADAASERQKAAAETAVRSEEGSAAQP